MDHAASRIPNHWLIALVILVSLTSQGCVGFASHVLYWIQGGHKIPAEYPGLAGQRVAIVSVANASSVGSHSMSRLVERAVAVILNQKVKRIEIVPQDEIADWIDQNDWDQMDYREIGRGVSADKVLAIDLDSVRLHEGMTLYKGRADLIVTVYDMNDEGTVVFRKTIPDFTFPRNSARHATEMSEARFREMFVMILSQQIAKHFYEYRIEEDFAHDAVGLAY